MKAVRNALVALLVLVALFSIAVAIYGLGGALGDEAQFLAWTIAAGVGSFSLAVWLMKKDDPPPGWIAPNERHR